MNNIKKYALSELYDMNSGISTNKEQAGHGSPFVSFSTVFNNYFIPDILPDKMNTSAKEQKTYSIRKGDIFITRTSETINELAMSCVALRDYPATTYSGFIKRLRPKTDRIAYYKYIAFYMRGYLFRTAVTNNAFMTLRASFNEDIFSFLNIYLPNYEQQVLIGDFLYKIEQKIQLNHRINSELEAMAKTIYNYWFMQFDFPDEHGKPYRASGGEMVWNEELKRDIPKEWSSQKIGTTYICHDSKRVPLSSKERITKKGIFPYYGATGVMDHINNYIFDGVFLLVAEDGSVADKNGFFLTQIIEGKVWINNHAHVLEPKDGYSVDLLNQFLKNIPAIMATTGTVQKKINQENLNNLRIINIPKKLRCKYNETCTVLRNRIFVAQNENKELLSLREWLLPLLMNGQAKVITNNEIPGACL